MLLAKLALLFKKYLRIEQERIGNVIILTYFLGNELVHTIHLDITPIPTP